MGADRKVIQAALDKRLAANTTPLVVKKVKLEVKKPEAVKKPEVVVVKEKKKK